MVWSCAKSDFFAPCDFSYWGSNPAETMENFPFCAFSFGCSAWNWCLLQKDLPVAVSPYLWSLWRTFSCLGILGGLGRTSRYGASHKANLCWSCEGQSSVVWGQACSRLPPTSCSTWLPVVAYTSSCALTTEVSGNNWMLYRRSLGTPCLFVFDTHPWVEVAVKSEELVCGQWLTGGGELPGISSSVPAGIFWLSWVFLSISLLLAAGWRSRCNHSWICFH